MTTTKKYNRKEIFKTAWNLVRRKGLTFSEALKHTWNLTKKVVEIKAKELAERIAKYGMPTFEKQPLKSDNNQGDFSFETKNLRGVWTSTIAR